MRTKGDDLAMGGFVLILFGYTTPLGILAVIIGVLMMFIGISSKGVKV